MVIQLIHLFAESRFKLLKNVVLYIFVNVYLSMGWGEGVCGVGGGVCVCGVGGGVCVGWGEGCVWGGGRGDGGCRGG